jgi:hypothetical protein
VFQGDRRVASSWNRNLFLPVMAGVAARGPDHRFGSEAQVSGGLRSTEHEVGGGAPKGSGGYWRLAPPCDRHKEKTGGHHDQ